MTAHDLAVRLNSATVHLLRALRQDAPPGLQVGHRTALSIVVHQGPLSIGALARAEGVTAAAMTRTGWLLETRGLVRRERDAADGRLVRIRATRAGTVMILRGRAEQVARIGQALAELSPSDTRRLEAALGTLEHLVAQVQAARGAISAEARSAGTASAPSTPVGRSSLRRRRRPSRR